MGTHRRKKPKKKGKQGRTTKPYPFEFWLKVVKLYLEDGYSATLIAEQFGISDHSVYHWSKRYRQHGCDAAHYLKSGPEFLLVPTSSSNILPAIENNSPIFTGPSFRHMNSIKDLASIDSNSSTMIITL